MIIVRTKHDLATEYLYAWTEEIIREAESKCYNVHRVEGSNVNFKNFEKRVKKLQPTFIFFNGHGSKSCLYDNNKIELVNLESSDLLKNTITFAQSCDSLVELGGNAVRNSCNAFVGYKKKFLIPRWHKTTCKPLQDLAAKPILKCSNVVAGQLIRGKTVQKTVDQFHQETAKEIVKLIYSEEPYASPALRALIHNDSALEFKGKSSSKIKNS